MKTSVRLTAKLHQQIVNGIRAGGYPHIAAQAWDVSAESFRDWLQRGESQNARGPYRTLARDVRSAHAQARLKAEIAVLADDPRYWLEHGPGRDRTDSPGWSVAVKPAEETVAERNLLLEPDMIQLLQLLTTLLAPHPEVRRQLAQSLMERGVPIAA